MENLTSRKGTFLTTFSKQKMSEAGMALVLIFLLLELFLRTGYFYKIATILLLVNMIIPKIFYPFAIFWYGLSNILGSVVSKFVQIIVFVVLVIPVGLFRKLLGKDSMRLKDFKKGTESVMIKRDYIFSSSDIKNPY